MSPGASVGILLAKRNGTAAIPAMAKKPLPSPKRSLMKPVAAVLTDAAIPRQRSDRAANKIEAPGPGGEIIQNQNGHHRHDPADDPVEADRGFGPVEIGKVERDEGAERALHVGDKEIDPVETALAALGGPTDARRTPACRIVVVAPRPIMLGWRATAHAQHLVSALVYPSDETPGVNYRRDRERGERWKNRNAPQAIRVEQRRQHGFFASTIVGVSHEPRDSRHRFRRRAGAQRLLLVPL